jgi:cytochrome c-type biogenesis protein CcmE
VIALSVATTLGVFLLYTSLAGGGSPSLRPSQLAGYAGKVTLAGLVLRPVRGDAGGGGGLHFVLRDIDGTARVPVVYRGSVPDLFRTGRHVYMQGQLRNGVFVAAPNSLVTKCPSKYVPKRGA